MLGKLKLKKLTFLETASIFVALLCFGMFIGSIMARTPFGWETVSATAALIAVGLGVLGFLDNRRSQRLEHRAYVEVIIGPIEVVNGWSFRLLIRARNYGRTPAVNLRVKTLIYGGERLDRLGNPFFGHEQTSPDLRIHPSADFREIDSISFEIPEDVFYRLRQHERAISIGAKIDITYDDMFGDKHSDSHSTAFINYCVDPQVMLFKEGC